MAHKGLLQKKRPGVRACRALDRGISPSVGGPANGSTRPCFCGGPVPEYCGLLASGPGCCGPLLSFCEKNRYSGSKAQFCSFEEKSCNPLREGSHWTFHRVMSITAISGNMAKQKLENPNPRGGSADLLWQRVFRLHL